MIKSEAALINELKLEAGTKGIRLWRNNVGAVHTADGTFIRFGLANESSQMNHAIKSSDLIGIKEVLITQDMVGKTIGQFVCREVKKPGWKYTGTDREMAQLAFIQLINMLGGDGAFAAEVGTL
jgi:hypothetical protein